MPRDSYRNSSAPADKVRQNPANPTMSRAEKPSKKGRAPTPR
eukprot:g68145.t1